MLKVIRTQLHTISQLCPILGPHWVAPGNIRLSSSWWPDGYSSPSCVLNSKPKRRPVHLLAIPAAFPVVTLTEPALHCVFFKEPVVEEKRGWRSTSQVCCTPIAQSIPQGLKRRGRRRAWSGIQAAPLPFPFPTPQSDFSECRSDQITPAHLPADLQSLSISRMINTKAFTWACLV